MKSRVSRRGFIVEHRRPRGGPISSGRITPRKASERSAIGPISMPKTGCGLAAPKPAPALLPAAIVSTSGLLADDVCRKIRPETGTFGRELWGMM